MSAALIDLRSDPVSPGNLDLRRRGEECSSAPFAIVVLAKWDAEECDRRRAAGDAQARDACAHASPTGLITIALRMSTSSRASLFWTAEIEIRIRAARRAPL